ncbi:ion channel POLLUX-like 2 [Pyrus ussuriensis x Pyrus communis]|uniref:Ion channel POLLUX-like 2 n=1 Tax=Pyrus ussuriensis x Pyrus communis TaxID=2448454 RepID=A0A5N5EW45_9ROSA|nr:ion channel POLLUX-like 2 [Pyrus ussuriensis x Pyrus communis]
MSKFPHETKSFNSEFHEWYNMEPPPLLGSSKVNPTSLFSSVDSETSLKSINQVRRRLDYETSVADYWNHKLMKAKKRACGPQRSREGNAEIEEECNKGFEKFRQLAKGKEPR